MLIGQDRAGKTSLKKSLLGLPFDSEEPSTDGIKVDASRLEIEVDRVRSADWKPACEQPESWDKEMAKLVAQLLPKESQSPGEPQRPQTEAAPVSQVVILSVVVVVFFFICGTMREVLNFYQYWTNISPYHQYWTNANFSFNPFTPESDQCQISSPAPPEILHHTVRRTWLYIAYSDER